MFSNKKTSRRKGKVQLINANELYEKRRKSLGNKRNDIPKHYIDKITKIYGEFRETEISKIFDNEETMAFKEKNTLEYESPATIYTLVWPDGSKKIVRGIGKIILNTNGQVSKMIGTVQDITEQEKAENLIRTMNVNLAEAQHLRRFPGRARFPEHRAESDVAERPAHPEAGPPVRIDLARD